MTEHDVADGLEIMVRAVRRSSELIRTSPLLAHFPKKYCIEPGPRNLPTEAAAEARISRLALLPRLTSLITALSVSQVGFAKQAAGGGGHEGGTSGGAVAVAAAVEVTHQPLQYMPPLRQR